MNAQGGGEGVDDKQSGEEQKIWMFLYKIDLSEIYTAPTDKTYPQ